MPIFNSSAVPSVISVHSGMTYLDGLSAYNQATNLLGASAILGSQLTKHFKSTVKDWFEHHPHNACYNNLRLKGLTKYLRAVLADPLAFGAIPFVDMLYLTIDVPETIVSKLPMAIKSYSGELLERKKMGAKKLLEKDTNKDAYLSVASFFNRNDSEIRLYWGLHEKVREKRPKQRLVKVSFNPARHTVEEIQEFFRWLKTVIGVMKGRKLLKIANVTRLDIAMDIYGAPIQYLMIDRPRVKIRDFHANEKSKKERFVGTQKFGRPDSNCFHAYNKARKYRDVGPGFVKLLVYNTNRGYLPVSRVERVFRPADTKPISLGNLEEAPYFLKGTEFYKPKYLRCLPNQNDKRLVEKYGFSYWLHEKNKKQWELFNRVRKDHFEVDNASLKEHQISVLSVLKNIIINA